MQKTDRNMPTAPQPASRKKCPHNREPSRCIACGGTGICQHKKIRNRCVQCQGSYICMHGKIRNQCVECKGSSICEHGKRRNVCVECNGSCICVHGKRRSQCVECKGSGICKHGKQRPRCVKCKGSGICKHQRQRNQCVECNGSSVCKHGKWRSICITCKGSSLCFEHWDGLKRKGHCKQCNGTYLCKSCHLCIVRRKNALCATCGTPGWQGKTKEKAVGLKLIEWASEKEIPLFNSADKTIPASGTLYRMDFYYALGSFFLAVECDESEHALMGYPPQCELVRMYNIRNGLGMPAIFVRWNPDAFKIDGVTERVPLTQRYELLKETLKYHIKEGPGSNFLVLVTICYSQPAKTMHGEAFPYVTTQLFPTELDYETFVSNVYPNECKQRTPGTPWYMQPAVGALEDGCGLKGN